MFCFADFRLRCYMLLDFLYHITPLVHCDRNLSLALKFSAFIDKAVHTGFSDLQNKKVQLECELFRFKVYFFSTLYPDDWPHDQAPYHPLCLTAVRIRPIGIV